MSMTTRQMVEPPSRSWSIAGRSSPFFQLSELALTPNPSMVWKRWLPLMVKGVPLPPPPLLTVMLRAAEVVVLPAASRATAVTECEPLPTESESQERLNGLLVSSVPAFTPSTLNCTPTTRSLSEAFALNVTVPETVAPLDGAVSETVGACVSPLPTTIVRAADVVMFPAASRATAVTECVPLPTRAEFHERLNGELVSSVPAFAPSTLNWTPTTRTLSDALALSVTVPDTVAPLAGAVSATDGACVSPLPPLLTVTVRIADVVTLPAASRAM